MSDDIELERLADWAANNAPEVGAVTAAEKFPGGQSNPTYKLTADGRPLVLRRKPFGKLLPSAHAVDREFRLISGLHPTGFPVPKPIALCEDKEIIGAEFYLMEMVDGRTFWDGTLPDVEKQDRRGVYEAMTRTLAQLHNTDYVQAGLGDFGRPGNFFARQVDRWTKQYRAAQTDDIPEIEKLIDWLPKSVPEQTHTSIIHGDYRIDNLIYAKDSTNVIAVIDWELATIGDPLADFAYLAMNWEMPAEGNSGLKGADIVAANIPTLGDVVDLYCALTNRDTIPDLPWYFSFNMFRYASIVQGIKKRSLDGNASSEKADKTIALLMPLAEAAWEQAQIAGA
ncbi:MAG: phosphotransferase family protein [Pseudomonadota bacterium]